MHEEPTAESADVIRLSIPHEERFVGVARIVVGGLAACRFQFIGQPGVGRHQSGIAPSMETMKTRMDRAQIKSVAVTRLALYGQ